MAIQRHVRKIEVAPGLVRYRVLVTGEECPQHTHESRIHLNLFIHWLADNQTLLECGLNILDTMRISHNGSCWQAEVEAEVEEAPENG